MFKHFTFISFLAFKGYILVIWYSYIFEKQHQRVESQKIYSGTRDPVSRDGWTLIWRDWGVFCLEQSLGHFRTRIHFATTTQHILWRFSPWVKWITWSWSCNFWKAFLGQEFIGAEEQIGTGKDNGIGQTLSYQSKVLSGVMVVENPTATMDLIRITWFSGGI